MKTLIVYATRHGFSAEAARRLAGRIRGETVLVDLKRDRLPPLADFSGVIVGGSIHAGRIQKRVTKFLTRQHELLHEKKLGLFLSCMEQGEKARKEFEAVFPAEFRSQALASGIFGGAFDFAAMNFVERFMVRKVAKVDKSVSRPDDAAIAAFADTWNKAGPAPS